MGVSTLSSFSKAKRCSFQGHPPWEKSSTSPLGSTWKLKESKGLLSDSRCWFVLTNGQIFRNHLSFYVQFKNDTKTAIADQWMLQTSHFLLTGELKIVKIKISCHRNCVMYTGESKTLSELLIFAVSEKDKRILRANTPRDQRRWANISNKGISLYIVCFLMFLHLNFLYEDHRLGGGEGGVVLVGQWELQKFP